MINHANPVSDEQLRHFFDRFYRTEQSRNSQNGGYGLGLSIAKALVEAKSIMVNCCRFASMRDSASKSLVSAVIRFVCLRISILIIFIVISIVSGKLVQPVSEGYERQKQFIAAAGHEIKTPITIIDENGNHR